MESYTTSSIVLNSSNIVSNGYNNTLQYDIPGSAVYLQDSSIAVQKIVQYYSQYNINASLYANNTFEILIPYNNGTIDTQYTLSIDLPDGYYSYSDINNYVQNQMISIGAYLVSTAGGTPNAYWWQITENQAYYSAEIDQNVVPTSGSHAGYTLPASGLWSGTGGQSLPTVGSTMQTVINSNIGSIFGLAGSASSPYTFPTVPETTNQVNLSTQTPQVNPVLSYFVRCSLVNNTMMVPSDILASYSSAGTVFGGTIIDAPSEYAWITIPNQSASRIVITITDQLFRPVQFQDSNIAITLLIKQRN